MSLHPARGSDGPPEAIYIIRHGEKPGDPPPAQGKHRGHGFGVDYQGARDEHSLLPRGWPAVAESGVASAADAQRMMRLGYGLALIGTALMSRDEPAELLREILATTRTVES